MMLTYVKYSVRNEELKIEAELILTSRFSGAVFLSGVSTVL